MKTKLLTLLLFGITHMLWSQEKSKHFDLSFDNDTIVVYQLSPKQKQIIEIGITGKFLAKEINKIKIVKKSSNVSDKTKLLLNFQEKKLDNTIINDSTVKFNDKWYVTIEID